MRDRSENPASARPSEAMASGYVPSVSYAKGLLMLMGGYCVAVSTGLPAGAPVHAAAKGLLADQVLLTPAFMFLAGIVAKPTLYANARIFFDLRILHYLYFFGLAFVLAGLFGMVSGVGWSAGLMRNQPGMALFLSPLLFALLYWPMRRLHPALILAIALLLHIYPVVLGGKIAQTLSPFIYFAVGIVFQPYLARFARLIAREPSAGLIGVPIVLVFFNLYVLRGGLLHPSKSIADFGPAALSFGLAAGFTILSGALALENTRIAPYLARLGRVARPAAILWLPLFCMILALVSPGGEISPSVPVVSRVLFAYATLGLIFVFVEWLFDSGFAFLLERPHALRLSARKPAGRQRPSVETPIAGTPG